jgi:hypothetical protein
MQIDGAQVKSAVLDQLIHRHDYKDNHDVDVYNYLHKHH